ncbi:MAG: DUF2188 domain-containing protein [Tenericutes bacterium]|nr:DUF2188 domain-containing protein [Mycoplasmatota bacterium]
MFLNFIDQYGIFFGLLLGVILGLVIAYLLFSRPKKITSQDNLNKEVELKKTEPELQSISIEKQANPETIELVSEDNLTESIDSEISSSDIKSNEIKIITDKTSGEDIEVETVEAINLAEDVVPAEVKTIITDTVRQPQIIETKEVVTPPKPKKKTTKTPPKVKKDLGKYHVLFRKVDSQWYVKREGSDRIVKVLHTQKEAIAFATIKSITQKTSIVIHKRDGKIRKQMY